MHPNWSDEWIDGSPSSSGGLVCAGRALGRRVRQPPERAAGLFAAVPEIGLLFPNVTNWGSVKEPASKLGYVIAGAIIGFLVTTYGPRLASAIEGEPPSLGEQLDSITHNASDEGYGITWGAIRQRPTWRQRTIACDGALRQEEL